MQTCRIAVITDVHFSARPVEMDIRKGQWGDVLLQRTVYLLNRYIKPDVTVVLGDLLNDHEDAEARDLLRTTRKVLDKLTMPWLAIPGNHDPDPQTFYTIFDQVDHLDVKGTRIVTFDDAEQPHHNAHRSDADFARMASLAAEHHGPLVAVQHVPTCEPRTIANYGYTNHEQVNAAMREHGYTLSIAGHDHAGVELQAYEGTQILGVRALCETPYPFAVVAVSDADIGVESYENRLPEHMEICDYHSHTQFAYCSEDVSMDRSPEFAELMGVRQLALTEHSGQLHFERRAYWSCAFGERGLDETAGRQERMAEYWQAVEPYRSDRVLTGLEVDADYHGNLVVTPEDFSRSQIVLGAVHWLRELQKPTPDLDVAADEFCAATEGLCRGGVNILAHPFRVFGRSDQPVPTHLYPTIVKMLRKYGTAAEINFHSNEPQPEFFAMCLDAGIPISFGGDAHGLYEIGLFHPQLELLKSVGFNGELKEIMLDYQALQSCR